jgi:hypothetical protein
MHPPRRLPCHAGRVAPAITTVALCDDSVHDIRVIREGGGVLRMLLRVLPRLLGPTRFDADIDPFLTDEPGSLFD